MTAAAKKRQRCAVYTRKSTEAHYDDGGLSGGTLDRPALQHLLADIEAGLIDVVVVYKVDRLTRSLIDFAKLVEQFDARGVSFVSVTQQFNTTSSMGRLTLNVLLSFAQFEREVISDPRPGVSGWAGRCLWAMTLGTGNFSSTRPMRRRFETSLSST
jgi:DNA invertase Pin-like site-specific DNA recombinase